MADQNMQNGQSTEQPAVITTISLSQALLAPLDAIFKAQIHAARSFLNMLLQIGYPHGPVDEKGFARLEDGKAYNQEFYFEVQVENEKKLHKVSIPALALVPMAPLAVKEATFKLSMRMDYVTNHEQMQASERDTLAKEGGGYGGTNRPWFLVSEPVSIRGNIAPSGREDKDAASESSVIEVEIKVEKTPMPAGLDKLLTFLTQTAFSAPKD